MKICDLPIHLERLGWYRCDSRETPHWHHDQACALLTYSTKVLVVIHAAQPLDESLHTKLPIEILDPDMIAEMTAIYVEGNQMRLGEMN
jgi:hypothetical protein